VFDWNDLRYLLAVSRAGTLSGAACELGVKHTTVARRLAALEDDLGAKLVRKGGESYALTPEGEEVLALAEEVQKAAHAIERRVRRADDRVAGVVRVTVPAVIDDYLIKQLGALRARHPELVVSILADHRPYDLLAGEADVAVRIHPKAEGDLLERKLFCGAWSLYASRAYVARKGAPRALADFAAHDLIGYEGPIAVSPGGRWFCENFPDATYAMRGNSVGQVFQAALGGYGVTVLPCFMADVEPELVRLTEETFPSHPIRVLVPPDLARLARVRAVVDFIVGAFQRDHDLFTGKARPA
jgi:DNA-binding transcriptional LysR family regulator